MSVYVASSWRNNMQPAVVHTLRSAARRYPELEPYDFRNPRPGDEGFRWIDVGLPSNDLCTPPEYLAALEHPRAVEGFESDWKAMNDADTFVLILPCGRSAHLELGWAVGAGKRTAILLDDPCIPELMYKMVDFVTDSFFELLGWLGVKD